MPPPSPRSATARSPSDPLPGAEDPRRPDPRRPKLPTWRARLHTWLARLHTWHHQAADLALDAAYEALHAENEALHAENEATRRCIRGSPRCIPALDAMKSAISSFPAHLRHLEAFGYDPMEPPRSPTSSGLRSFVSSFRARARSSAPSRPRSTPLVASSGAATIRRRADHRSRGAGQGRVLAVRARVRRPWSRPSGEFRRAVTISKSWAGAPANRVHEAVHPAPRTSGAPSPLCQLRSPPRSGAPKRHRRPTRGLARSTISSVSSPRRRSARSAPRR